MQNRSIPFHKVAALMAAGALFCGAQGAMAQRAGGIVEPDAPPPNGTATQMTPGGAGAQAAPGMQGGANTQAAPGMQSDTGAQASPGMRGGEGAEVAPGMQNGAGLQSAPGTQGDTGTAPGLNRQANPVDQANQTDAGSPDVVAGGLPPEHRQGKVAYRTGGIGIDQSTAFKSAARRYPLSLEFARRSGANGNEYLSDVVVKIADTHGETLLSVPNGGPFMLVSIPAGHYVISATTGGKTIQRTEDVSRGGHAHATFVWTD